MAETITITEPETGPMAPEQEAQDNQSERPEWLPEKFKSPEDMAKSYSELEKKLSQPNDGEPEQAEEAETEASPAPQFDKFAEEFAQSGELSADSFTELEAMGYPRDMVETYIKGMTATQSADANEVMQLAGGAEGYQELTDWARDNMPMNELEVYNQMVSGSTDNAKMAVEWLMSKREVAGAVEPNLLSGRASGAPKDAFRSTAEVVQAMKDPRYTQDPAFRRDVEDKLARSSVF
jgi:hypothetical protein